MTAPQFIMHHGRTYQPVNIPATGQWQLMRLESIKCYILVNPAGLQAWFHDDQVLAITQANPKFRYTSQPLRDLNKLARLGLVPFHVDPDFSPDAVLAAGGMN